MTKLRIRKANTKRAHYLRYELAANPAVNKAQVTLYVKRLRDNSEGENDAPIT